MLQQPLIILLEEDGAMWELNFQLGTYRQKKGMRR